MLYSTLLLRTRRFWFRRQHQRGRVQPQLFQSLARLQQCILSDSDAHLRMNHGMTLSDSRDMLTTASTSALELRAALHKHARNLITVQLCHALQSKLVQLQR